MMRHLTIGATLAAALVAAPPFATHAEGQLGARTTDEWVRTLESPARVAGLKIAETLAALKIQPGQAVADIGAGTGIFTLQFGPSVRPGGKVYAVEVDEGLVHHIAERATEQGLGTIVETIYGDYSDPLLPALVDLAFINDVLHHIENRAAYLKALAGYLKPSGRVALIDFIPDRGSHRSEPALQISREQADALMAEAGLKPVEEHKIFDDKYFVIYAK
jgi:ubiquinone/menaquinone biosynthesis C-methylase UbiE